MPVTRLIIALPNRLLAMALADYVEAKSNDIVVGGVATDTKEIFTLLERCPASVLLYDPYLPGPCPQVVCSKLKQEFTNLNIIFMKNKNSNRTDGRQDGNFIEAKNCHHAAIIGSDALPEEFLSMVIMMSKKQKKPTKPKKTKKPKAEPEPAKTVDRNPVLSQRERDIVNLIAKGHSAKEIAFVLDLSIHTARNHTRNILNKLKLNKKIQLISWHLSR